MNANTFQHMLLGYFDYYGDPDDFGWNWKLYELEQNAVAIDDYSVDIADKNDHVEGNYQTSLYIVFHVDGPGGEKWFKKTGFYQSYEGAYWDGPMVEVFPQTKTITVWDSDVSDEDWDSYDSY